MSHKIFRSFFVLILIIGLVAVATPQSARAAGPWYVATTGSDANDCLSPATTCATINGAIGKATSGDTVNVAVGTYTGIGNEVVLIDRNITLSGGWNSTFTAQSGMSTIDGQGARQGLTVNSVATTVEAFIIQNGFAFNNGGGIANNGVLALNNSNVSGNSTTSFGGGIANSGALTVNSSTFSGNTALGGGGISNTGTATLTNVTLSSNLANSVFGGGGIANFGSLNVTDSTFVSNSSSDVGGGIYSNGPLNLARVIFASNSAPRGGGIFNQNTVFITEGTFSGNNADGIGGGIDNESGLIVVTNTTFSSNSAGGGGGIWNIATLDISSSTFSGNSARSIQGGGIASEGTTTLRNTILAGNTANNGPDCSGTIGTSGYNLIGNISDCSLTPTTGDLVGTSAIPIDPLLGPLQDNGGPTFTHALLPGSPAIDAGNPAGCTDQNGDLLTTDQRGVARPQGGRCDIGAFELVSTSSSIEVTIDIKPGSQTNPINSRSLGTIPVAILSSADFDAPSEVDRTSLTFGRTGDEHSLAFCNKNGADVNGDGLLDLLCHFKTRLSGFQIGDIVGTLRAQTVNDIPIEGQDIVKIVRK